MYSPGAPGGGGARVPPALTASGGWGGGGWGVGGLCVGGGAAGGRGGAASMGTPTSLIDRTGSGEMTVRAEKFTRFPLRFERNRPSFPLSRWTSVFSGG